MTPEPMNLSLTARQQSMLDGGEGPAIALAMRMVVGIARVKGAAGLIEIQRAHVDSCLYHGESGIAFVEKLVDLQAVCRVSTTTNVGAVDLMHPALRPRSDQGRPHSDHVQARGARLMDLYAQLGVHQTWTCAPYQLPGRPEFGEHIAWAESNAIVFANSVLGARTDRYGDFLDICAALTGLVPLAGLHLAENRRAAVHLDCSGVDFSGEHIYPLLGYLVGRVAGTAVPVLTGVPESAAEDDLKALGAAAASSGGVALFHVAGVTPEAPDLGAVCDPAVIRTVRLDDRDIESAQRELSTVEGTQRIDAISLGTPHASLAELRRLAQALTLGMSDASDAQVRIPIWVNTGRFTLREFERAHPADAAVLERAGVTIVTDTCNYLTPLMSESTRVVMTNSGKWAHYAPGTLGVDVVFASLDDCIASAVGR